MKIKNLVTCVMLQIALIGSIYSMEKNENASTQKHDVLLNNIDYQNSQHSDIQKETDRLSEFEDLVEVHTCNISIPHKEHGLIIIPFNFKLKQFCNKKELGKENKKLINTISINNHDYIILRNGFDWFYSGSTFYYSLDTKELFNSLENLLFNRSLRSPYNIIDDLDFETCYNIDALKDVLTHNVMYQYINYLSEHSNIFDSDMPCVIVNDQRYYGATSECVGVLTSANAGNATISDENNLLLYKMICNTSNGNNMLNTYFILRNTDKGKEKYFLVRDSKTNNCYFMLQNHTNNPKFFNSIEDVIAGKSIASKNIPQKYYYIDSTLLQGALSHFKLKQNEFLLSNNKQYYKEVDEQEEELSFNSYHSYSKSNHNNQYAKITLEDYPQYEIVEQERALYGKPPFEKYYYVNVDDLAYYFVYDTNTNEYYYANCQTCQSNNELVIMLLYKNIEDIINDNTITDTDFDETSLYFIREDKINEFIKQKNLKVTYNKESKSNENQEIIKNSMSNNVDLNNNNEIINEFESNENIKSNNNLINNINNNEKSENKINGDIINNKDIQVVNPTYMQNEINNEINNNNFSENNNDIINNKNISNIIKNNTNKDNINEIKLEEAESKARSKLGDESIKNNKESIDNIIHNNDLNKDTDTPVNNNNNMKDNTIEQNKDVKFENLVQLMRKSNNTKSKISTVDEFLTKLSTEKEYKEKLRNSLASLKSKDDRSISTFLKNGFFNGKDISITPKICQAIIAYFDLSPQKLEKK